MNHFHEEPKHKSHGLLRLELFSDAVFAIAITLLILECIQTLHSGNKVSLPQLLHDNWRSLVVFLVGFLTILVCWINHHFVLSYAERSDSNFLWVNGFVLLIVTFTPFPTAILAEYLESDRHLALGLFGFNYILMSVAAYCITAYIHHNLVSEGKADLLRYAKKLYAYSIAYTVFASVTCFFSYFVAQVLYALLFIVFAFPKEFCLKLQSRSQNRKRSGTKKRGAEAGQQQ